MNVIFKLMNGFSKFKNPKKTEIFRQGLKNLRGELLFPQPQGSKKVGTTVTWQQHLNIWQDA